MLARKVIITTDREAEAKALQGVYANHSHYTRDFEDDVEAVTPEGRLIGRLFPGELADEVLTPAYDLIKTIKTPITRRGSVVGKNSLMPRINSDGSVSEINEVPKTVRDLCGYSDTIGHLGPSGLFPNGRLTSYTRSHKKARPALTPVLREIDKIFYEEYPAAHAWQAEGFPGNDVYNWYDQMGDQTAFSSAYGNNMVRSGYHQDAANLGGSLSALFTVGDYEGGGLVIPRFGVCFNLQPGDLLLFHGDDIHGVLPFKGERHSGVFFSAAAWGDFWEEVQLPKPDSDDEADEEFNPTHAEIMTAWRRWTDELDFDPKPLTHNELAAICAGFGWGILFIHDKHRKAIDDERLLRVRRIEEGESSAPQRHDQMPKEAEMPPSLEDLVKLYTEVIPVREHDRVIFCFIKGDAREWVRIDERDPDVMRAKFAPFYGRGYVPFAGWHWWGEVDGNSECESNFFPPFDNDESIDRAYSWPDDEINALVNL